MANAVKHKRPVNANELVQLKNFRWFVPQDGYRWILGHPLPGAVDHARCHDLLVPSSLKNNAEATELNGALFREFAELMPTRENVLSFANHYGWLGIPELVVPSTAEGAATTRRGIDGQVGEEIGRWTAEIGSMYRLVRLWAQITKQRASSSRPFSQHVRRLSDALIYEWETDIDFGKEVIASERDRPELFKHLKTFRTDERVLPFYLQLAANEKLRQHKVAIRLLWDSKLQKLGLTMVPENLIGFLWLQLARAIHGETAFRRCEDCGRWFPLGGRSSRSDKRFCSGTCKSRTHRALRATHKG